MIANTKTHKAFPFQKLIVEHQYMMITEEFHDQRDLFVDNRVGCLPESFIQIWACNILPHLWDSFHKATNKNLHYGNPNTSCFGNSMRAYKSEISITWVPMTFMIWPLALCQKQVPIYMTSHKGLNEGVKSC